MSGKFPDFFVEMSWTSPGIFREFLKTFLGFSPDISWKNPGHFLGNFKEKSLLGIRVRRERAPFVFTPQMAHVMGGNSSDPLFARFESLCVEAYNTLREHGHLLLNRFISMLPSALPELESQADINYLRDKLELQIPPADAADRFKKEIDNALGTVSRQIDNMVHMSVHN